MPRQQWYYGSYGLVRGYGPLHRTLKEADDSVRDDGRHQRRNGGATDRNAVLVSPDSGKCWWLDGDEIPREETPVLTAHGEQATYSRDAIRQYESLWDTPETMAGFG